MPSLVPTFSVSINRNIIDKPDGTALRTSGKGWEPVELSESRLAGWVGGGGAYAPQFRGGRRKASEFLRCGFLAADVDGDMTLEEANDHAFVRHHAALIHTTASHTPESHRFRVVFLLQDALGEAQDWADAQLGIALTLDSDRSVSDAARFFFGNTQTAILRIGKTISPQVVAELVARGRDARATRAPGGGFLPVESVRRIAGPELVRVAGGELVRMDELGVGVPVHCPHHDDGDPSAFTLRSRLGQLGIHCSACKVTFWSTDGQDGYDFNAFDRLFEALQVGERELDPEAPGLERFFPPAPGFVRHQLRYLPTIVYEPGVTLVKSPKGSGKTVALRFMCEQIKAGRFRGDIDRKNRPTSILLIGHRQSLIREAAANLGLRCYLDPSEDIGTIRTLAVCLDSLPKYNESSFTQIGGRAPIYRRNTPFDLVIIDEVEQVLGHLLSETISKRRGIDRCFDALMYEVSNAKAVIALDADLGLVTTHAMRTMRPQDWHARCRIIYNAPLVPVERRVMRLHMNKKFLERQVIEAVKRGERCFIVSNSKKFIDTAHRMILDECGEGIIMRVITRDNSRDEDTVSFLADIKTRILLVQVLLGSPSIGTGIDITFPGDECLIDRVFGFFYPFVNTHTDIDQQIARVRNPGEIDVWISPATYNFTCNVDVIKDDLGRAYAVKRAVTGRRDDGMVEYNRDDPLLMICAHVTALQRASKNRLIELFCSLREANGWTVELVTDIAPTGPYEPARKMLEAERTTMMLEAQPLCDVEYMEFDEKISKGANVTLTERIVHEKSHFERTVGCPLDAELVRMNLDGRLLDRTVKLAEILAILSATHSRDKIDLLLAPTAEPKGRLRQTEPGMLIAVLVRSAELITPDGLAADHSICVDDLSRFVRVCRDNQTVIEEVLGEQLRDDIELKPIRQLNRFLRPIGLKLTPDKTKKIAGRKLRYYRIAEKLLGTMTRLSRSYLEIQARSAEKKEQTRLEGRKRRRTAPEVSKIRPVIADNDGLLSPSIIGEDS
jgi:hypothetical protein